MITKQIKTAYKEYLNWYENLGIDREYFRDKKLTSVEKFAHELITDDELFIMFGEDCTENLTLIERQEIFKNLYPRKIDIRHHRYYDDHCIPTRRLSK